MTDVSVRTLGEDDWQQYRTVRLAALSDAPDAFAATVSEEEAFEEDLWRDRMRRSTRLIAEQDGEVVGVVSVGEARPEELDDDDTFLDDAKPGEIFGLWVSPGARGLGVATALVKAGARQARTDGRSHVAFWVSTENGPAVAFASGMGFRPTDFRRPMNVHQEGREPDVELAMVLPLGEDFGPNSGL